MLKVKFLALMFFYAFSGIAWASDFPLHESWMKDLDDDLLYTQISIPGTHDSASDHAHCLQDPNCGWVVVFASTQTYPISDQLKMGIRFFDIRLAYEEEDGKMRLRFHHGPYYLQQYFGNAVDAARDFLADNPSEFLIFMIKQEDSSEPINDFWWALTKEFNLEENKNLFFLEKRVLTVGEARGKIIVMARSGSDYDHGFTVGWSDNTPFFVNDDGPNLLYAVEDHYSLKTVSWERKYMEARANLTLARNCPENALYITYLTGEGDATLVKKPSYFACYINPAMADWLANSAGGKPRSGIIAMDYAGDSTIGGDVIIEAVIGQNYPHRIPTGFGNESAGGGIAAADINGNGLPDLIFLTIDNPDGENRGFYRIGWDITENGVPSRWQDIQSIPWAGWENAGGGITTADVNRDGTPDLIVFMIDNPDGANAGYHRIGFMNKDGSVSQWTDLVQHPGTIGNAYGGIAAADINGNGLQELIVFSMLDMGSNSFGLYRVGWDINEKGVPNNWQDVQSISPWLNMPGHTQQGGGITATDANGDGIPDLVVFMVGKVAGPNRGYYKIGFMNRSGSVYQWSDFELIQGWFGAESAGGGIAAADINGNGLLELIIFTIDNPAGENQGYYRILWDS